MAILKSLVRIRFGGIVFNLATNVTYPDSVGKLRVCDNSQQETYLTYCNTRSEKTAQKG